MKQKSLFIIFTVISIIGYGAFVYAAAPIGGYTPGQTLNPDCAPGDVDCVVALPASWSLTGNSGTDSGVTNFLGTTDAQDLVFKTNNFEQMRIKSNGLIGFGVTNPANEFHMSKTTTGGYDIQSDSYGQQGTFTINRSSGTFAAPTRPGSGAILGTIGYGAYDSGTFATTAKIIAAMDAATGAGDLPTALSFQTTPDGSATALERLRITNGGRLGLGTTNPSAFVQTVNQITTGENAIFDRYGNTSGIQFRMAGGTLAAPTAIVSGNRIFRISGSGYNGSAFSNNRATIGAAATENWTTTANGTKLEFAVTTTGSNILQTKATINENGLGINNSFPSANSAFVVGSGESFRVDDTGNLATINSVNYIWPSSQATGSGQVLTNDGSGNLTWAPGGGSAVSLIGSTNGLVSNPTPGATTETWLGYGAGAASASTSNTIFIGQSAGSGAVSADSAIFLGTNAGYGAISANNSNFLGQSAGYNATNANNSNFFGRNAGNAATNAEFSNFFGFRAGMNATSALQSNFFGIDAGNAATSAYSSNFFGQNAGNAAGNAYLSNFFGSGAGQSATGANNSNFFGSSAGASATSATYSNFFGNAAGANATNANNSNFFAKNSGLNAINANYSNFFGYNAGNSATSANDSNFLGQYSGQNATNANNSNFIGRYAGSGATNATNSNFFGQNAGYSATSATSSNFLGNFAGYQATDSVDANFFGYQSGYNATHASSSNFFGYKSGYGATNADTSNFLGQFSGYQATDALGSNFLGNQAGYNATNASYSNFLGIQSGYQATNASSSNFFGRGVGYNATNAANSIFIGTSAGFNDTVNNTGTYDDTTTFANTSILIGHKTLTNGYSNSIALGAYARNTASNQFMIGSTTRPINEVVIKGSGTCSIVATGISCSSDERLKTNIEDLENTTLDIISNIRTVRYNWNSDPTGNKTIGFLAQDLEQYYPELVRTDSDGFKMVNYAQMTPILVEAIREMNLQLVEINDTTKPNSIRDNLIAWFGNVENGITDFFTKTSHTETLCVGTNGNETCITKDQLDRLLGNTGSNPVVISPTPDPTPTPTPDPGTDVTVTDPSSGNDTVDTGSDQVTNSDNDTGTPVSE